MGSVPPTGRTDSAKGPTSIFALHLIGMHPILTALSVLAERRRYDLKDVLKIR